MGSNMHVSINVAFPFEENDGFVVCCNICNIMWEM